MIEFKDVPAELLKGVKMINVEMLDLVEDTIELSGRDGRGKVVRVPVRMRLDKAGVYALPEFQAADLIECGHAKAARGAPAK
jgi:hypothetical protein